MPQRVLISPNLLFFSNDIKMILYNKQKSLPVSKPKQNENSQGQDTAQVKNWISFLSFNFVCLDKIIPLKSFLTT
jgi:hypothetical protein